MKSLSPKYWRTKLEKGNLDEIASAWIGRKILDAIDKLELQPHFYFLFKNGEVVFSGRIPIKQIFESRSIKKLIAILVGILVIVGAATHIEFLDKATLILHNLDRLLTHIP